MQRVPPEETILRLNTSLEEIEQVCKHFQVSRLELFGSILRDDYTEQSDIDVLVEFVFQENFGYMHLYDLEYSLSRLFQRETDLIPAAGLHILVKDEISSRTMVIYDRKK